LHGNGEREFGDGNADIVGQRLEEDTERLPKAHAERQHQRGANQDRERRAKRLQERHG
jgi:hypothetical protein